MSMKPNVLRLLIIFFIIQRECQATKCYQCNSKNDEDCANNQLDTKYLKSCPNSYRYCRKAVYIYYFTKPQEQFTVRECAKWGSSGKECYWGRYKRDSYQFVCECKGPGCNRSTILSFDFGILVCTLGQLVIYSVFGQT